MKLPATLTDPATLAAAKAWLTPANLAIALVAINFATGKRFTRRHPLPPMPPNG
jgi:hypothetical protein